MQISILCWPRTSSVCSIFREARAGRIFADLTLRRSGATAAAEGHLSLDHYALDLPTARGQVSGKFDSPAPGRAPLHWSRGLRGPGRSMSPISC